MRFKEGVDISGITKECIRAIAMTENDLLDNFGYELTVTSVCDGKHMDGSKHYEGNAFDLRTWEFREPGVQLPMVEKEMIAASLSYALGADYDVIAESTHIHVEYDPKQWGECVYKD